jgi:hypothetical protein
MRPLSKPVLLRLRSPDRLTLTAISGHRDGKWRSRLGLFAIGSAIFLIVTLPGAAYGQGEPSRLVTIADEPTCGACTIRLLPRTRITVADGPGIVAEPRDIVRDSRGRLYITSGFFVGEIKVYDGNGGYLRHLTTRGAGPGEAQGVPKVWIAPGDTVHVFDNRNARHTVFSPDYRLVRDVRLPLPFFEVTGLDATSVVVAAPRAQTGAWFALHMVTSAGDIVRSFDTSPIQNEAFNEALLWRHVAKANSGGVWAAPNFGDYRVDLWTRSGTQQRTLSRSAPWFTPSGRNAALEWRPGATPPPASIAAIREDSRGRLWVMCGVAKQNWKKAYDVPRSPAFLMIDVIIEVLDPTRGVVVTRQRMPQYLKGFVDADVFGYEEDANGSPIITVWQIDVINRSGGVQ